MKHICPYCNSENVQAFRVVFESGTSTAVHNTAGVGVGFNDSGSIGLGVGGAQTTSTSMSLLAGKTAPPALKKPHWGVWALIVFGCFGVQFGGYGMGTKVICGGLVALGVYLLFLGHKWNKTEHPRLMAQWERSWLCHSCGRSFESE